MPNGHIIESTYDTANRKVSEKFDDKTAFSYEYDKNGNETKVIDSINSIIRTKKYNKAGQIINATDRDGISTWTYKENSTKIIQTAFTQNSVTNQTSYEYNSLDQNTIVRDSKNKNYIFDYDEKGNVRNYTAGNNSSSSFTYDVTGKLTALDIDTSNNDKILSESYKYDENDNRTEITSYKADGTIDITTAYQYDTLDQLTKEELSNGTIKEYTYDGNGNRTSVTVTDLGKTAQRTNSEFNIANQLVKFGSDIITYDKNGNRTEDGQYKYTWNAADQLTAITKKDETNPFATYKYDDNNRRIEKNVNGQITRFYYDGESINPLYETDGNGNIIRSYVYSATGVRLAMQSNGSYYYYHYNSHGDVVALTDNNENIVVKYTYDAWGNTKKQLIPGQEDIKNPFTYAGYMHDEEIGMYYLIARYYNPLQGVFLSMDPDPGDDDDPITQNGYTYADNDPVMQIDSDGEWAHIVVYAGVGAYRGYKLYKTYKKGKRVYKLVKSTKKRSKYINGTRQTGVNRAWKAERAMIAKYGQGSRKWSGKRRREILEHGRAKGFVGHHINSVKNYPQYAGLARNIRFVTPKQHYRLHGGNWKNQTTGKFIKRRY